MIVPLATVLPLLRGVGRPPVDGTVEEVVQGGFRVHFTRDGADAVPDADEDGDGLPDTIDTIRDALVDARSAYEADGWIPLVPDDGDGGGDEIDVYVRRIDAYGYATPVPVADGSSCHLQLDPATSPDGGVLRSVVFHELHHCVQFRYTAGATSWLYESGATWQQYTQVVGPTLDLASGFLWLQWLSEPDRSLADTDGRHEYAAFVFTKFWAERGGTDPARLRRLWTGLADPAPDTAPSWIGTLDREARAEWGDGLDAVWLDHATWNAFACAADDGAHYDPAAVPCVAEARVAEAPFEDGATVALDDAPYTATYRSLDAGGGPVRVTCRGPGQTRLVARDADGAEVEASDGEDVQVDVPEGGSALLVLAGGADRPLSRTCTLARPRPAAGGRPGAGCATAPGGGLTGLLLAAAALGRRARSRSRTRDPRP